MNLLRSIPAVLLPACLALGQRTWLVNCQGGPGIDFTDLPQAVAAAAPGDTIWVFTIPAGCPGVGGNLWYTAPAIDKPLNILGFGIFSTSPPPGSFPSSVGLRGVLTITGIGAGERVVVSHVGTGLSQLSPSGQSGVHLSNCSGGVVLEYFSHGNLGFTNETLEIQNCADVTIRGSGISYGGDPLSIVDSAVRLSGFHMNSTPPLIGGGYTSTTPAITLTNSTLTVTNSLINGSDQYLSAAGGPQAAVHLIDSTMYLGPGANLRGGQWLSFPGWYTAYTSPSPVPSYVYQDPRTFTTGASGNVYTIAQDIPATYIDFAVANDWTTVTIAGPTDGFALLLLGDLPLQPTPTPFGSLRIDPSTVMLIDLVALPGGSLLGFLTKDYFVPAAVQYAHAYSIQALTLSPAGQLGLTMATPFCVGWQHGLVP